jgi:hypothetical protein
LKLLLFIKVNIIELELKQYLLRADYESKNNQQGTDWFRNLGVGAVSQLRVEGGLPFTNSLLRPKIVQCREHGVSLDLEEA